MERQIEECNPVLTKPQTRFRRGDAVKVVMNDAGRLSGCKVVHVHIIDDRVKYDLEVTMHYADLISEGEYLPDELKTRIYQVDSAFIQPATV